MYLEYGSQHLSYGLLLLLLQGKLQRGHYSLLSGCKKELGLPLPCSHPLASSPLLSYELSGAVRINSQPLLTDRYERRYVYVKQSQVSRSSTGAVTTR